MSSEVKTRTKDRIKREPLKSYKEGKYLIFENTVTNKVCKYDLSNGDCLGFSGKKVKDVKTQLRGYHIRDVIDSFENEAYKKFLGYVETKVNTLSRPSYYRNKGDKITNVGTFLGEIKEYDFFEPLFAMGITRFDPSLKRQFKNINEIPSGLLKLCRKYNLFLSKILVESYIDRIDLFNSLTDFADSKNSKEITTKIVVDLLTFSKNINYSSDRNKKKFIKLIYDYNYNPKSLLNYVENLIRYEALTNDVPGVICEIYDYAKMQQFMRPRFEKYPRHFLSTHQITSRNYNRFKKEYRNDLFKKVVKEWMEFEYKDFYIEYPKTTEELKEGAVQLNNCLCSYIEDIIEQETDVVFLKNKKNKEKILVAIEVKLFEVVQASREYCYSPTKEQEKIIDKYKKYLDKMKNKNKKKRGKK